MAWIVFGLLAVTALIYTLVSPYIRKLKKDREVLSAFIDKMEEANTVFRSERSLRAELNYIYSSDSPTDYPGRYVVMPNLIRSHRVHGNSGWGDFSYLDFCLEDCSCDCGRRAVALCHQYAPAGPRWEQHIPYKLVGRLCLDCLRTVPEKGLSPQDIAFTELCRNAAVQVHGVPHVTPQFSIYR